MVRRDRDPYRDPYRDPDRHPDRHHMPASHEIHIAVLGAGGVGKSCLTAQYVFNQWIESYDPTIEDTYRRQIEIDGRQVRLEILDTAGTEQFVSMRDLYMKTGQGFLLVFSITSPSSLMELTNLHDEIRRIKDGDDVPMVIVGNKADLEEMRGVPRAKGFSISQRWGAPYYESSARTRSNVEEVFTDLCRQIIRRDDHSRVPVAAGQEAVSRIEGLRDSYKRRQRRSRARDQGHDRCLVL
ncbi:hypothetical protein CDD81_7429 [Ophiocordyceps australis]|uniref:Uncharacterized protein n=1 Tax=Ophiocordyceps australis TaxID=1399860 RepID=A0A2C5YHB0_9HYPO|nr:hypothetical protein CDD81_7429 [Ophiocordyceps australis]